MNRDTPWPMRSILILAIAACSSNGPKDPAFTPAGPKPCEKMADHFVGLMQPKDADGKPIDRDPDTADKITNVLIKQCTDEKWTVDAQSCFTKLAKLEDIESCAKFLTVAQRDALAQAIDVAFPRKPGSNDAGSGSGSASP
jgi:hypothetical protein